ncbi:MAG TPA: class I adenylate-forming enzyme family protein [Anaerolineae bacterium]|nr:class I adenylate-forming enzyme family protein [Anaerolineae bacterium]
MLFQDLLYQGAHRTPDKLALRWVERDRTLTYAQAVTEMERVAGALAALGVRRGDRVGVFAHNGLDYVLAMFGTWRLGAAVTLVNVQYAATLAYFINDSTPRVLIYTGDHFETIDQHRPSMPCVEHYLCLDGEQPGALAWQPLLDSAAPPPPDPTQESDPAHISYTSGTTGLPKGAVLAHEPTNRATSCIAERLRLTNADVTLGPTALSSSYHLVANLLPGLRRGATVNVMSRWEAQRGWQVLEELGVSLFAANPTLLRDVLDVSRQRGRPPARLRAGVSGGGPVPPDLKLAWRDELKLPLVESYGQSELGGFVGLGLPEVVEDDRVLAIGLPLPDKEVRIVDEADREVPIGQVGEIVVRGGFMVGYWQRPEKTAETLRGGWLHTGDMGRMDADGYIYMLGRWAERIVSSGRVIFPRGIEEALYRHPAVRQACVIGRPDPQAGHLPKAIVTLYEGQAATPDELLAHCRTLLPPEQRPALVEIIAEMPMTPTGKIGRAELQAQEQESSS